MTTMLLAPSTETLQIRLPATPRRRATLIAGGIAAAVLLSASALRPFPGTAGGKRTASVPHASAPVARSVRATAIPSRSHETLEAVAGFVASRYRVSREATRGFVAAAHREAARHGLDPLLVVAVIGVESSFNPAAQSDAGAVGLMQVIPRFHADKIAAAGDASILEPATNISIGTRILKEYIQRAGGETEGLQMYNGSANDPSNAYAKRVQAERQRLHHGLRQASSLPSA